MIRIEVNTELREAMKDLGLDLSTMQLMEKMQIASDSATSGIKEYAVKQIPKRFTADSGALEKRKYTRIWTESRAEYAEMKSEGKRLPLTAFKHSPTGITRRSERLSASVLKGSTVSKYPGFKQRMRGFLDSDHAGNLQIFQRTTKKPTPLRMLRGASVSEMLSKSEIKKSIRDRMIKAYIKRFEKELSK